MIKMFLTGRLCADPELRTTTNGHSVCNLRVAVRTSRRDAQGETQSDFYNIVTWNGLADSCAKFLKKGSVVYVTGEPSKREYTDKNEIKHTDIEITAENLEFGPAPSGQASTSQNPPAQSRSASPSAARPSAPRVSAAEDDLPF